ncbi:hypothetical protein BJ912DRAFT_1054534 [Pholiota molesta]|nr:hypothetical protein BJ912DRAFT_1054534 [Pholiota molesta]
MLATSKVENRKQRPGCPQGPHISPTFELRTLCSERLSAVGQEIIDLSGKAWPCGPTLISGHEPRCAYEYVCGARGHYVLTPYPEGTRGFFYFHSPADGPELCAGVRFRICESAAEFARGRDLLGMRGNMWGPKVLELVIVIVIDYTQHWPLLGRCVPKVIPIHASYVSSPPDPEHIDHTEMSLQLFA